MQSDAALVDYAKTQIQYRMPQMIESTIKVVKNTQHFLIVFMFFNVQ